jgi:hypothetical protein
MMIAMGAVLGLPLGLGMLFVVGRLRRLEDALEAY